jgi:glycyl-tRNA synthetase beta subunit
MAEDPEVKANRMSLLRSMRDQFARVARFSEIHASGLSPAASVSA